MLPARTGVLALALAGGLGLVSAEQFPQAPAQGPRPGQTTVLQAGKSAIYGRVIEAGTTSGVSGAVVMLSSAALGSPVDVFPNGIQGGPRRMIADAQGQFLFRELPPGAYRLTANAPGYAPGAYGDDRIIQVRRSLDLSRSIEIIETDGLVRANVPLFRRGGVSGRVVDEVGEPIVGAQVLIASYVADWSGPVVQPAGSARTDDRGAFHADLAPGDYVLLVSAATNTAPVSVIEARLQAQATSGNTPSPFQPTGQGAAAAGTRVGGFVVAQPGNSLAVPAMSTGDPPMFYPTTFHPSSTSMAQAAIVTIGPGEEKQGIDIQMRPHRVVHVSGRILGLTGPASNVVIWLVPNHPSVQRTSPATTLGLSSATADDSGQFTFMGIVPGEYLLYASKPASGADQTAGYAWSKLTVGVADLPDVQIVLQSGSRISGRVAFEGAAPPAGDTIRRVIVSLRPAPGSLASMRSAGGIPVDPAGTFRSHELAPGPYAMSVTPPADWTLKSVMVDGRDAADRPVDLTAAGLDNVVVTLTSRRTSLGGTVRGSDSEVGPSVTVVVFPTDKSLWRQPGMASRRVQTAAPGRDGRYSFATLPPGEYFLAAPAWPAADFSDGAVLSKLIPIATRVALTEGQTMSQDLRVEVIK